jgi:hypothetical protein
MERVKLPVPFPHPEPQLPRLAPTSDGACGPVAQVGSAIHVGLSSASSPAAIPMPRRTSHCLVVLTSALLLRMPPQQRLVGRLAIVGLKLVGVARQLV